MLHEGDNVTVTCDKNYVLPASAPSVVTCSESFLKWVWEPPFGVWEPPSGVWEPPSGVWKPPSGVWEPPSGGRIAP